MRLDIHGHNIQVNDELREHVERRLDFAVGRFQSRLAGVTVRLSDENGPKGGVDMRCQITAKLNPSGRVVIEDTEADMVTAVTAAADRLGRAVRRELDRRRTQRMNRAAG